MVSQNEFSDDTQFRLAVEEILSCLLDQIDEIDADFDPRLSGANLSITYEDGSVLMLSQQTPTHELWLSANYTAWHFRRAEGIWIERDTAAPMTQVLNQIISDKIGITVNLSLQ